MNSPTEPRHLILVRILHPPPIFFFNPEHGVLRKKHLQWDVSPFIWFPPWMPFIVPCTPRFFPFALSRDSKSFAVLTPGKNPMFRLRLKYLDPNVVCPPSNLKTVSVLVPPLGCKERSFLLTLPFPLRRYTPFFLFPPLSGEAFPPSQRIPRWCGQFSSR